MKLEKIDSLKIKTSILDAISWFNEKNKLKRRHRLRTYSFALNFDDFTTLLIIKEGVILPPVFSPGIENSWDFSLSAASQDWQNFLMAKPVSPFHHLFAMWARIPSFRVDGNRKFFLTHSAYLNEFMKCFRLAWNGLLIHEDIAISYQHPISSYKEILQGAYWHVPIGDESFRIYVEQSGQGKDILFLHTAGSDTRQYAHLMNDEYLTSKWRMTAFDLPGHGKSTPPESWMSSDYLLTEDFYLDAIRAICKTLQLHRPLVVGCSMAGAICLRLAQRYPDEFSAVVACEAAEKIPSRLNHWLIHPEIDSSEFSAQWIDGLMAPETPLSHRNEILFSYSQAAAGIFYGDVAFYSGSFQMSDAEMAAMDTSRCPVYLLTGSFDYSCTPEMSQNTANKIPGSVFIEMRDLGHFPVAENPKAFKSYLVPILENIYLKKG